MPSSAFPSGQQVTGTFFKWVFIECLHVLKTKGLIRFQNPGKLTISQSVRRHLPGFRKYSPLEEKEYPAPRPSSN
jgi:hypothetical protein